MDQSDPAGRRGFSGAPSHARRRLALSRQRQQAAVRLDQFVVSARPAPHFLAINIAATSQFKAAKRVPRAWQRRCSRPSAVVVHHRAIAMLRRSSWHAARRSLRTRSSRYSAQSIKAGDRCIHRPCRPNQIAGRPGNAVHGVVKPPSRRRCTDVVRRSCSA